MISVSRLLLCVSFCLTKIREGVAQVASEFKQLRLSCTSESRPGSVLSQSFDDSQGIAARTRDRSMGPAATMGAAD